MLIDKLILNEELKERYKENGFCQLCVNNLILMLVPGVNNVIPNISSKISKNWTATTQFIQKARLKAKNRGEIIE